MKYLRYLATVLWTLFRKIPLWIPYILAILPFRGYARNVVQNYVLANGVYLKRLLEKTIIESDDMYEIISGHGTQGGYIKKRSISWIEYKLVYYVLWQWMDDDSWYDTWSIKYNESIVDENHKHARLQWLPQFIKDSLQKDLDSKPLGGNAFDIGDKRADNPSFGFWSVLLWTVRNTAYNSKYMTWEKQEGDKDLFYYKFSNGWQLGWKAREDKPQYVNGKLNYDLVFLGWD